MAWEKTVAPVTLGIDEIELNHALPPVRKRRLLANLNRHWRIFLELQHEMGRNIELRFEWATTTQATYAPSVK
ncbi:hypothetical protein [Streptomyces goshikiensis]|uniref:hypothetical protein n=1 Tax=Streptomyces goshikiensis TaxID=1942 RepID=UPI0036D94700